MEIMETIKTRNGLFKFLGITLFAQAVTSLVGGSIFLGPFDSNEITDASLRVMADSTQVAYISMLLQMITGVVIIMLGVAMYRAAGHKGKTIAVTALGLYIFEAVLLAVGQVFVFGLVQVSQIYSISGDANLLALGKVLLSCRGFAGEMAMIPFGVGAILFYYLLMKAEVLPKWLALWGLITVPLILVCVPLATFGIETSFALLIPYVPFEFFTGIYILIKYRNTKVEEVGKVLI